MPRTGSRCDEISPSRVDACKTDQPRKKIVCFAEQTHEKFGRRIWVGKVGDEPKAICHCVQLPERYQNTFVDRWRRSSEIGRNQIKIEDAAPAFHLLLEEFEEEMVTFEKFPNLAIEPIDNFIELTQLSDQAFWPLKPAVRSKRN